MSHAERWSDRVRRYYQLVDEGDVPGLLQLFSPDVVYERPGYEPIRGRAALEDFYRDVRVIVSGRHSLRSLVCADAEVAVQGDFAGVLRDGDNVRLRFADFFQVTADGLFSRRNTYFFQPLV